MRLGDNKKFIFHSAFEVGKSESHFSPMGTSQHFIISVSFLVNKMWQHRRCRRLIKCLYSILL